MEKVKVWNRTTKVVTKALKMELQQEETSTMGNKVSTNYDFEQTNWYAVE